VMLLHSVKLRPVVVVGIAAIQNASHFLIINK
jgi:hypothetical protein